MKLVSSGFLSIFSTPLCSALFTHDNGHINSLSNKWSKQRGFGRTFVNKKLFHHVCVANEKAYNCLLRIQTCDHIGIMKQSDMTVGPISQIILDQIKFGPDGPGAVKFDSNRLFCKLCSSLIIELLSLSGHGVLLLSFGTSSGCKIN